MAYLNHTASKFKLRNESDLRQQIEEHLPIVANYKFPYRDTNGNIIKQEGEGIKEKDRYTIAIGDPKNKMFKRCTYESARMNKFASPLFMWLLDRDQYSVTPEEIFTKAVELYGDPIVALGVIPWIMSGDALTVDRGTSSVVSFNLEQLV